MEEKYLTVSQLNRYIKYKIDHDTNLTNVFLKGEISNFKAHTRGHLYFTLKDETSRINAVMFQSSAKKLTFLPEDGMKVMVVGKVSVYEASGGYQIYVEEMMEDGVGNLALEFEKLKKKLSQEGLFDPEKKKRIPKFPKRIGVVTAPTGAAIRDILTTIKRRWPIVEVILFPSLVQGASAAPDVVRQIERAQHYDLDTLIVGRGGGSIEDLWCFNDEMVARAIYQSHVPVISGVGHEIDFTIADFVADLRAPTPTAAAELAVPNQVDFQNYLHQIYLRSTRSLTHQLHLAKTKLNHFLENPIFQNPMLLSMAQEEKLDLLIERLQNAYPQVLRHYRTRFDAIKNTYVLQNPEMLYRDKKTILVQKQEQMQKAIRQFQEKKTNQFVPLLSKLQVLDPLLTIQRGYAITRRDGKVIDSVQNVKVGEMIEVELRDGTLQSKIVERKEK